MHIRNLDLERAYSRKNKKWIWHWLIHHRFWRIWKHKERVHTWCENLFPSEHTCEYIVLQSQRYHYSSRSQQAEYGHSNYWTSKARTVRRIQKRWRRIFPKTSVRNVRQKWFWNGIRRLVPWGSTQVRGWWGYRNRKVK